MYCSYIYTLILNFEPLYSVVFLKREKKFKNTKIILCANFAIFEETLYFSQKHSYFFTKLSHFYLLHLHIGYTPYSCTFHFILVAIRWWHRYKTVYTFFCSSVSSTTIFRNQIIPKNVSNCTIRDA